MSVVRLLRRWNVMPPYQQILYKFEQCLSDPEMNTFREPGNRCELAAKERINLR